MIFYYLYVYCNLCIFYQKKTAMYMDKIQILLYNKVKTRQAKMLNFENILNTKNYKIDYLNVTSRQIFPPDDFICSDGMVLFDRLFYIVKGKMEFILNNGQKITFKEHSIVYLPYNITYISKWVADDCGEFISVNYIFKDKKGNMIHLADNITLLVQDTHEEILKTFREIWDAQNKVTPGYPLLVTSLLYMIIYKITKTVNNKRIKKENAKIYKAIQYLEANYMNGFDLNFLAKQCNLSPEMFRIYFLKTKGMPPIKYKNHLRLEKAYEMLSTKEYSVKEVSAHVGFEDAAYFSRIFKKTYGFCPTELTQ